MGKCHCLFNRCRFNVSFDFHFDGCCKRSTSSREKWSREKWSPNCISEALELCLRNNYSEFEDELYLQTNGTAMGFHAAPHYANLFMEQWDLFVRRFEWILEYMRFLDDGLVFANVSGLSPTQIEQRVESFKTELNSIDRSIQFTLDLTDGGKEVIFLDQKLHITPKGISYEIYAKPTNYHSYLQRDSCHKPSVFKSVVRGVAKRVHRSCVDEYLNPHLEKYKAFLVNRGYGVREVIDGFASVEGTEAASSEREESLDTEDDVDPIIVSTVWNPRQPCIDKVLDELYPILKDDKIGRKVAPSRHAFKVIHRTAPNLRAILAPSKLRPLRHRDPQADTRGCRPCNGSRCKCCSTLVKTSHVKSHHNGFSWKIRQTITCKTKWVVYLIRCTNCKRDYVGSTKAPMHVRCTAHRSDINNNRIGESCLTAFHFNRECGGKMRYFQLFILESITGSSLKRKKRS